ncbi:head-tail connector protein [Yersinia aleksiciae]|uniref:Bacteriophage protein n=1 Tax=Yersinia aleksiciae TaxID=263819 RepID=A0ABN4HAH6_YERAE|nr:head-tail connector protein [Yersinia aleksiciae]AKP33302.1 bacteriophage protein [Yersinia aleksiciae]CFQ42160.1 uncharacterized phage protein (possible DNA packaging) [Yersinia aleksiciae]
MNDSLITLEEVKLQCRIEPEFTEEDSLIKIYIDATLEVCQRHIGKRFDDGLEFTPAMKVGCLMYVTQLYESRSMVADLTIKEVPLTISHLWTVYREPGIY